MSSGTTRAAPPQLPSGRGRRADLLFFFLCGSCKNSNFGSSGSGSVIIIGGGAGLTTANQVAASPVGAQHCAAELLTDRDRQELGEAKEVDGISWNEENIEERNVSLAWEESLYAHLTANGVAFLTEGALLDLGFRSTPDAILLDDLFINGKLVRWLDAKCFYGSSRSKLFLSKLKKQCDRYRRDFGGGGAICYKLGFSRD